MKLTVEGMTCGHCVRTITRAIQSLDPKALVTVDLATGVVAIDGDVDPQYATTAIEAAGYTVVAVAADQVAPTPAAAACCGGCRATDAKSGGM